MLICEKAKGLLESLRNENGKGSENDMFVASRGWLMHFKAQANLHNLNMNLLSADDKVTSDVALAKIIREGVTILNNSGSICEAVCTSPRRGHHQFKKPAS